MVLPGKQRHSSYSGRAAAATVAPSPRLPTLRPHSEPARGTPCPQAPVSLFSRHPSSSRASRRSRRRVGRSKQSAGRSTAVFDILFDQTPEILNCYLLHIQNLLQRRGPARSQIQLPVPARRTARPTLLMAIRLEGSGQSRPSSPPPSTKRRRSPCAEGCPQQAPSGIRRRSTELFPHSCQGVAQRYPSR